MVPHQVRYPRGQNAGLPRTRTGKYQNRTFEVPHGGVLFGIEGLQIVAHSGSRLLPLRRECHVEERTATRGIQKRNSPFVDPFDDPS